jgi:hypothetical protein
MLLNSQIRIYRNLFAGSHPVSCIQMGGQTDKIVYNLHRAVNMTEQQQSIGLLFAKSSFCPY